MLLTKREIFERLKQEGIDLGGNPFRTFLYYQETGIIPEPEGKRKNAFLFPERAVEAVRLINKLQKNGESITEIRKRYNDEIAKWREIEEKRKKEIVVLVHEALIDEVKGLRYQKEHNGELPQGVTAKSIADDVLEKYGNFVKELAIKKLIEQYKFLEDGDIKSALLLKKTA